MDARSPPVRLGCPARIIGTVAVAATPSDAALSSEPDASGSAAEPLALGGRMGAAATLVGSALGGESAARASPALPPDLQLATVAAASANARQRPWVEFMAIVEGFDRPSWPAE
jgi:hypothetical protein